MATKHGKLGKVFLGNTEYSAIEWDGDDQTEPVEITSTTSGGFQEMDPEGGITSFNGSITFLVKTGQALPLTSTNTLYTLLLYEGNNTNTDCYTFAASFSSLKHANKVKGSDPITVAGQYHSSGPIGYRTATIPS